MPTIKATRTGFQITHTTREVFGVDDDTAEPNPEQLAALVQWAKERGRKWRADLREAWYSGNYAGFSASHLLQQIRNNLGPSWLIGFTLPRE